jgi:hypothetical protein
MVKYEENDHRSSLTVISSKLREKEKIKKSIIDILLASTAHGIPNIFRSNNLFLILMWSTVCCISVVIGSYFVLDNILDYLNYNTVTTISVVNEKSTEFPTISLCSHPGINRTLNETILRIRFDRVLETNVEKYFEEFNDPVFGKCFRFNSGRNYFGEKVNILNSTSSGRPNGLRIEVYVDIPDKYDFVEIIVYIHNHSLPPYNLDYGGYWITPGSWNYFEIERIFDQRLGEPYNDCLNDVNTFKQNKTLVKHILDSNRIYSQNDCFYLCSYLFALEESNCGCNSSLIDFEKNCLRQFYEENLNDTKQCVSEYLKEFRISRLKSEFDKCSVYCPSECDSMTYMITSSYEALPKSGKISYKSKMENGLNSFETYEQVSRHFSSILVYYKELKYTRISQEPKTMLFNVISNVGGILGLFLGISFLSFMEIFEMLFQIIYIKFFTPSYYVAHF